MSAPPSVLDALDAAEREATAGPWKFEGEINEISRLPEVTTADDLFWICFVAHSSHRDADFIALARNHLRSLIGAARGYEETLRWISQMQGRVVGPEDVIAVVGTGEPLLAALLAPHEESS